MAYLLDKDEISFPDPEHYHPESGIIGIGGDFSLERIMLAYHNGIFPWSDSEEEILWWCPDPRFVLFPDELKISKSMRKVMKDGVFSFTENTCFEEVIKNCQNINRIDQDGTWLNDELMTSFIALHHLGYAKSVEVWQGGSLVGGLYGLQMGDVFCGESMFSKVSNASKAGFIHFVETQKNYIKLIDCQVHTLHLESLGARMIPKTDFLKILKRGLEKDKR